ncbi:MAG: DeoR/GlpR family DNA-binding transcription regulator [Gammaproteobacteria bacterium]|nr:DeoR/GlpR family DNA-binding transcription regulator [Gammaproteobacteria bacterium]MCY4227566.1 DeoR/GlpR family DNA-binding transcription regulator [Gammaproteobacteria bacterium]
MKPLSRHEAEIFRLATLRGSCSITELAERLGVSDETVRRHIRPLVDRGQVEKVHGGIVLPDRLKEAPMERRMGENRAAKQAIARAVSEMIEDGDTLMLDTGSTTAYVAVALSGKQGLHVVTNSTEIGRILARQGTSKVYLVGGEVGSDQLATFGPQAIDFVRRFNVRHAILSIGGINAENELLNFGLDEADFSRAVIRQAASVNIVADYTKFSRHALVKVCDVEDIDTFITDRAPPKPFQRLLSENDTSLVIAA